MQSMEYIKRSEEEEGNWYVFDHSDDLHKIGATGPL